MLVECKQESIRLPLLNNKKQLRRKIKHEKNHSKQKQIINKSTKHINKVTSNQTNYEDYRREFLNQSKSSCQQSTQRMWFINFWSRRMLPLSLYMSQTKVSFETAASDVKSFPLIWPPGFRLVTRRSKLIEKCPVYDEVLLKRYKTGFCILPTYEFAGETQFCSFDLTI